MPQMGFFGSNLGDFFPVLGIKKQALGKEVVLLLPQEK